MSRSLLVAATALTFVGFGSQALADRAPTRAVSTAGVNFRDPVAVQALYNRLYRAADAVCRTDSANSYVAQSDRACVEKALSDAIRASGRPLLVATYEKAHANTDQAFARGYR